MKGIQSFKEQIVSTQAFLNEMIEPPSGLQDSDTEQEDEKPELSEASLESSEDSSDEEEPEIDSDYDPDDDLRRPTRKAKRDRNEEDERKLEESMATLGLLKCHICQEEAKNMFKLGTHMRRQHSIESAYIFCCEAKRYLAAPALDHMEYHMNKDSFKCTSCESRFMSPLKLQEHIRKSHTAPEEAKFKCETCGKSFMKSSAFKIHLNSHLHKDERPLECSHCEMSELIA